MRNPEKNEHSSQEKGIMSQEKRPQSVASNKLRSRAESILKEKSPFPDDVSNLSLDHIKSLLHELRVHQIELELQNQELRESQQELSNSRDAFIDLYDFAPVGYLTINDKGTIVQANLTAARMFAIDRGILAKKPLSTFVAKDDQAKYYLYMSQLKKDPLRSGWELRLVRSDTTSFDGELQVSPVLDIDGNFQHQFKVIISDISEKKGIEQALRDSESRFEQFMNYNPAIAWMKDDQGRYVYFNRTFAERFVMNLDECIGKTDFQIWPQAIAENFYKNDQAVLSSGLPLQTNEEAVNPDGSLAIWLVLKFPFQDFAGARYVGGVGMDISERVEHDKALAASNRRFKDLAELMPLGVYEMDVEGKFTFVNRAFSELWGRSFDEIVSKLDPTALVPENEVDRVVKDVQIVLHGSPKILAEYTGLRKDKTTFPISITANAIEQNGKIIGIRGVVSDITLLKQAERERDALKEQLFEAQRLASLGTLAGGIAHDFNNMLQAIIGYGELLMDSINRGRPDTTPLAVILETSHTAANLVKKLMATGQVSMVIPGPIDLNDKIRDLESLIVSLPNISHLSMDLLNEPAMIMQDSEQLGQIIMNLAINASEAMPDGGSLTLSTTKCTVDEDFAKTRYPAKPGPHLLLTVTDTGHGIEMAILPRIFDPFFSTKERGNIKGMGLGLSVARGVVQQHGGFMTCESELGKGTTFRVYFPAIQTSKEPTMKVRRPGACVCGKTILVVEDDPIVGSLEENAFIEAGYQTIMASNGKEAVDVYKERHGEIDVVILEIIMPDMNGQECLMELLKVNPMVKIIVFTGHDTKSKICLSVRPYVMGFIPKPCEMSQLVEVVESAMQK